MKENKKLGKIITTISITLIVVLLFGLIISVTGNMQKVVNIIKNEETTKKTITTTAPVTTVTPSENKVTVICVGCTIQGETPTKTGDGNNLYYLDNNTDYLIIPNDPDELVYGESIIDEYTYVSITVEGVFNTSTNKVIIFNLEDK